MTIEPTIRRVFLETLAGQGGQLAGELTTESILLQTGLDSLGFAILVSQLEQELGYDPFTLEETPIYPRTYGEFVALFDKHAGRRRAES